jgi:hypothetical protein
MASDSEFVAGTIEDVLIAMANGLAEAQEKLNSLDPFDSFGRPLPQYHMPYMDFNLKITVQSLSAAQFSASQSGGGLVSGGDVEAANGIAATQKMRTDLAPLTSSKLAMLVGMPKTGGVEANQREIISTISGRFVSVPPADGMPQVMLSATVTKGNGAKAYTVTLTARFGDGTAAAGRVIEANIDTAATMMAGAVAALTFTATDIVSAGSVVTDAAGMAVFAVDLSPIIVPAVKEVHLLFNLGPVKARAMVGGA